tara:strand:- start:168 stop:506 length:339 start_codon:yes stop_codon:yes gene_type:complete
MLNEAPVIKNSSAELNTVIKNNKKKEEVKAPVTTSEEVRPWDRPDATFIQKNGNTDYCIFSSTYKGVERVQIREVTIRYDRNTKQETRRPTQKGIAIAPEKVGELIEALKGF